MLFKIETFSFLHGKTILSVQKYHPKMLFGSKYCSFGVSSGFARKHNSFISEPVFVLSMLLYPEYIISLSFVLSMLLYPEYIPILCIIHAAIPRAYPYLLYYPCCFTQSISLSFVLSVAIPRAYPYLLYYPCCFTQSISLSFVLSVAIPRAYPYLLYYPCCYTQSISLSFVLFMLLYPGYIPIITTCRLMKWIDLFQPLH